MDNGQHQHNPGRYSQDPIIDGMTAGIGDVPEQNNPLPDNLNQDGFIQETQNRNYGLMGNTALAGTANKESAVRIANQDVRALELGQIIDMNSTPTSTSQTALGEIEQDVTNIDPIIIEHFADGKVSGDDIDYIKTKENTLDPADFVEFVSAARRATLAGKKAA